MTALPSGDPAPGGFTDLPRDTWIDRWVPEPARPYLRLMRLDRPIGTWLLLFPCWWSLALAAGHTAGGTAGGAGHGWPDWQLMVLFAIGAVVMRGAGCTVNDILDRDIDARVERTRGRPIPSGQVSVRQALGLLVTLLVIGLGILLQLRPLAIGLGVGSLALVFTYPLMKRITWWPQLFLGLTFNWGALMGWAAATGTLDWPAIWLYLAGIAWTLGYDTIYAHQDKEDDARVGVKSTALRLGTSSRAWIIGFYLATAAWLAAAGAGAGLGWPFYLALLAALLQMQWQVSHWLPEVPADSLAKFRSNRWVGWLVLGGIVLGSVMPG